MTLTTSLETDCHDDTTRGARAPLRVRTGAKAGAGGRNGASLTFNHAVSVLRSTKRAPLRVPTSARAGAGGRNGASLTFNHATSVVRRS